MLHALMEAAPYLALFALGAGLLYIAGRDPKAADEHDLSDYHAEPTAELEPRRHAPAPIPAQRRPWAEMNAKPCTIDGGSCRCDGRASCEIPQWERDVLTVTERDILPPAPPGMNAGSPLYAGMLFDTWHPDDADVVAARWLREIAAEEQAKAGIRPAYDPDRDMTGAFPVVAIA